MALHTDLLLDPFATPWADLRDSARAAEAAGFGGIWIWDHLAGSVHQAERVLEAWTTLTAVGAITRRINIGPLVLNVANRHPGVLATMAATLQEVTGGRLLLGIGAGGGVNTPYGAEQRALGRPVPPDATRRRQVREAVAVIRQIWTGRADPYEGRSFQLGRAAGFLRPDPPPPIIVGAFGLKMARLAGEVGDGINTQALHPRLEELIVAAREAHSAAGRDPGSFLVTVFAALQRRWVDPGHTEHQRLLSLGVDRLILLYHPPFDPSVIESAGRLLNG